MRGVRGGLLALVLLAVPLLVWASGEAHVPAHYNDDWPGPWQCDTTQDCVDELGDPPGCAEYQCVCDSDPDHTHDPSCECQAVQVMSDDCFLCPGGFAIAVTVDEDIIGGAKGFGIEYTFLGGVHAVSNVVWDLDLGCASLYDALGSCVQGTSETDSSCSHPVVNQLFKADVNCDSVLLTVENNNPKPTWGEGTIYYKASTHCYECDVPVPVCETHECSIDADCPPTTNPCRTPMCLSGQCIEHKLPDGLVCADDGDPCNGTHTCAWGECTQDNPVVCPVDYSCDPATGNCTADAECFVAADCAGKITVDDDQCQVIACVNETCVVEALPDDLDCSDANVCNGTETCQAGQCSPGAPVVCPTNYECLPDTGECKPPEFPCDYDDDCPPCELVCKDLVCENNLCVVIEGPDGDSCADENLCDGNETCSDGFCVAAPLGDVVNCTDPETCNPATGECEPPPEPECEVAEDCPPYANPCLEAVCDAGECTPLERPDDAPCPDADLCDGEERCLAGICVDAPAEDAVNCTAPSYCVPSTGECETPECVTADDCTPHSVDCHVVACVTQVCALVPIADGSDCADDNLCDGNETCAAGVCVDAPPSAAVNCTDGELCNEGTGECEEPPPEDECDVAADCAPYASPCLDVFCDLGQCVPVVLPDDTPCPDDDLCDGDERCLVGVCVDAPPAAVVNCTAPDYCNPATGECETPECTVDDDCAPCADACHETRCIDDVCVEVPRADGWACSDGDRCNGNETCLAGVCTSAAPEDTVNCTAPETCDPGSGECVPPPPEDECEVDGDCPSYGNPCLEVVCTLGQCVPQELPNGESCADADLCDGDEMCQDGMCSPGTPVNCSAPEVCVPETGDCEAPECVEDADCPAYEVECHEVRCVADQCVLVPLADDTPCPDGDQCNGNETCQLGVCAPAPPQQVANCTDGEVCDPNSGECVSPPPEDECEVDGDCAPYASPCLEAACVLGQCVPQELPNDTPCPDADLCDGEERCLDGVCVPAPPEDAVNCTAPQYCDPDSGECLEPECVADDDCPAYDVDCHEVHCIDDCCTLVPLGDGADCADEDLCDGNETCQAGVCVDAPPEQAVNCTDGDVCDAETGECVPPPPEDECEVDGDCLGYANPCLEAVCVLGQCVPQELPNGSPCPDDNLCNGDEQCLDGVCAPGIEVNCTAPEYCVPTTGECEAPECTTADDCPPCADECVDVQCVGPPGEGQCTLVPVADDTPCADADLCDGDETCQAGICVDAPPSAAVNCTAPDYCDPGTGECETPECTVDADCPAYEVECHDVRCVGEQCVLVPLMDGADCADDDLCDGNETCQAGVCVDAPSFAAVNCTDDEVCVPESGECVPPPPEDECEVAGDCPSYGNPCLAPACVLGQCVPQELPNGESCADANLCDGDETCLDGMCVPGVPVNCTDDEYCVPETGQCLEPECVADDDCPTYEVECHEVRCIDDCCTLVPLLDGADCADGDLCDGNETCLAGVCVDAPPEQAVNCTDGDVCDAETGDCVPPPPEDECVVDGDCPGYANPCFAPVCVLGQCVPQELPNGASCADADLCDGEETCLDGMCVPAPPSAAVNCSAPDYCDPDTGECVEPECSVDADCPAYDVDCHEVQCVDECCTLVPLMDGVSCADDDLCDGNETCLAGVCEDAPLSDAVNCTDGDVCVPESGECVPPPPEDECEVDDDCPFYASPCVEAVCELGQCVAVALPNGSPCPDGDQCNGNETCLMGVCAPAPPSATANCSADDVCNPATGECETPQCLDDDDCPPCEVDCYELACISQLCALVPLGDGASCADDDLCDGNETCAGGVCVDAPFTQAVNCTDEDVCVPETGECVPPPPEDECDVDADCPAYANPCFEVICDLGQCVPLVLPDDTPCPDADLCDGDERCLAGVCVDAPPSAVVNCSAPDYCDPDTGMCVEPDCVVDADCPSHQLDCHNIHCLLGLCALVQEADDTPCPDANLCDGNETCAAGICVDAPPSAAINCTAGHVCDPGTGTCSPPPPPPPTPTPPPPTPPPVPPAPTPPPGTLQPPVVAFGGLMAGLLIGVGAMVVCVWSVGVMRTPQRRHHHLRYTGPDGQPHWVHLVGEERPTPLADAAPDDDAGVIGAHLVGAEREPLVLRTAGGQLKSRRRRGLAL